MGMSPTIGKITEALVKVQSQLKDVIPDSENPYYKSPYAKLPAVWDLCRKLLSDNGLAVAQVGKDIESGVAIETILLHISGEWISGSIAMHPKNNEPQAYGAAITYARRYSLSAMVGITVGEPDDDACNATTPPDKFPKAKDLLETLEKLIEVTPKTKTDKMYKWIGSLGKTGISELTPSEMAQAIKGLKSE